VARKTYQWPGYIYLIKSPATGLYKIGLSVTPNNRLTYLISSLGEELEMVCNFYTIDAAATESELHDMFSYCRVDNYHERSKTEWFNLTPCDVSSFHEMFKLACRRIGLPYPMEEQPKPIIDIEPVQQFSFTLRGESALKYHRSEALWPELFPDKMPYFVVAYRRIGKAGYEYSTEHGWYQV